MCLGLVSCRRLSRQIPIISWQRQCRFVATHTFNHQAAALSVLPTTVDTSAAEFRENVARYGELMASMRARHEAIERGGPQHAKEKHIARGKMLPREYAAASMVFLR